MFDVAISKPLGGAPFGNRNARKHRRYAGDAQRVDMRTREDKAVAAAIRALEEDQPEDLSAAKRLILGGIARKLRDLLKLDAYLDPLASIVKLVSAGDTPLYITR